MNLLFYKNLIKYFFAIMNVYRSLLSITKTTASAMPLSMFQFGMLRNYPEQSYANTFLLLNSTYFISKPAVGKMSSFLFICEFKRVVLPLPINPMTDIVRSTYIFLFFYECYNLNFDSKISSLS
jgi:hypothetical protein